MARWSLLVLVCAVAVGQEPPTFLRGLGWSPWHAVYGWGRPPGAISGSPQAEHEVLVGRGLSEPQV